MHHQLDHNAQYEPWLVDASSWHTSSDFWHFPSLMPLSPGDRTTQSSPETTPSPADDSSRSQNEVGEEESQWDSTNSGESTINASSDATLSPTGASAFPAAPFYEEFQTLNMPSIEVDVDDSRPRFLDDGSQLCFSPKTTKVEILKAEGTSHKCNVCPRVCDSLKSLRYVQLAQHISSSHPCAQCVRSCVEM